jgi:hypothetical protein
MPTKRITGYFLWGIFCRALTAIGNANKPEILTRIHANSIAVNPNSDFLIRIYEVPHIAVSSATKIQF